MNGNPSTVHPRFRGFCARLALMALACVLAFSTLVSTFTIAELHDHDCTGDECPTCLVLELSQAALLLAAVGSASALASAPVLASIATASVVGGFVLSAETPVSLKVRLVV